MGGGKDEVVLLDLCESAFGMRVRIALAEKGVEYEYRNENLRKKSPLLLQMSPVHKQVPVLIYNNKPVCESKNLLLPSDPYLKAEARFWANFIDEKIYDCGKRILTTKGEEQEITKKEFIESLKLLEGQLSNKPYFGGDQLRYLDVVLVPYYSWFHAYESSGHFKIEDSCPTIIAWAKRCLEHENVSKSMCDQHKVYEFVLELYK